MSLFQRFDPLEECSWYGLQKTTPYQLDFLYFFVGQKNLATNIHFSVEYLNHLKNHWGIEKSITHKDINEFDNFWYFSQYSKEKFLQLSSKINLTKFLLNNDYYNHEVYLGDSNLQINPNKKWFVKSDFGFSGRNNKILPSDKSHVFETNWVVEEYLDRCFDFAITFLSKDKFIVYENNVTYSGQYVGTTIDFDICNDLEKFLTQKKVSKHRVDKFRNQFSHIVEYYSSLVTLGDVVGSFDFFAYLKNDEIYIHPCCEFNPRWTMGRVAWEIGSRYNPKLSTIFTTCFAKNKIEGFQTLSPTESKISYQVKWH